MTPIPRGGAKRSSRATITSPRRTPSGISSRAGRWCVGSLRYEAAGAFDPALVTFEADGPLASFAVYDAPLPEEAARAAWAPSTRAHVDWTEGPDRVVTGRAIEETAVIILESLKERDEATKNARAAII